jgi:hypothetical protein
MQKVILGLTANPDAPQPPVTPAAGIPIEYIYAGVAVVVGLAIGIPAGYLLMKRSKK